MQNLSLKMTHMVSLEKSADTANKGNTTADKASSTEKNSPFQMMLSKQVQAKQAPAKQAPVKQAKDKAEHVAAEHKNGDENKASDINVVTDSIADPSKLSNEQVKFDNKTLLVKKDDEDTRLENTTDSNPNFLAATLLAPVMNAILSLNTQATSTLPDANLTSQTTTTLEGAAQKQPAVDGLATADKTRQLDVMLPSATKQVVGDESANTKLMINAVKDDVGKDAAIKELVMPAAYQPVAQANNTLTTQQVGSTNNIYAYPGKAGWDQAISQKVMWMVGAGEQSATLTLNPPDLGPVQVVIHVHNDQADTTFFSDNAEVRQALQDGLSNLRDKMSESGVQLGQANVTSGQQSQQQFQQAMQGRQTSQMNPANATSPLEQATGSSTLVRVSNGLVDTFA